MARFWKRGADRSIERLMRANRPAPRDDFASSILQRIASETTPRRRISPHRYRLALVVAVLLVALAAALGGISAATAGVGNILHAATNVVTPASTDTSSSGKQLNVQNTSQTNTNTKNDANDSGSSADEQYTVAICHVEGKSGKVVLKYVPPSAVPGHLGHGDYYPTGGHC
jgi:hypothetical protein